MPTVIMNRQGETLYSAKREIAQYLMVSTSGKELARHIKTMRAEGGTYGEPVYVTITGAAKSALMTKRFPYEIR